jgi:hypothetical protein
MRLLDTTEMEIAADALSSHSGPGVARALFFYRTGDLMHREVLRCLTKLRTTTHRLSHVLTGDDVATGLLPMSPDQLTEIENVREATRLSVISNVLTSVTWVRREERTLFRCNPCVLFIAFIANTNVEKKKNFHGHGSYRHQLKCRCIPGTNAQRKATMDGQHHVRSTSVAWRLHFQKGIDGHQ